MTAEGWGVLVAVGVGTGGRTARRQNVLFPLLTHGAGSWEDEEGQEEGQEGSRLRGRGSFWGGTLRVFPLLWRCMTSLQGPDVPRPFFLFV